jgi:hypothetical protein
MSVYNAILFYILIVIIIVVTKPDIMYNHKTKRFRSFGTGGGPDQTLFAFPLVALVSAVLLYIFFLVFGIINNYLETN